MNESVQQPPISDEDLPKIKKVTHALSVITATNLQIFGNEGKDIIAAKQLMDRLILKAIDLGASDYEITRAILLGMPEKEKQDYFKRLVESYRNGVSYLTIDDLSALKQELSLGSVLK
jgi:hypothetical protein